MWTRGYDWDDVIHDEIASIIGSWYGQLRSVGNVQMPRCLREAKEVVAKNHHIYGCFTASLWNCCISTVSIQ